MQIDLDWPANRCMFMFQIWKCLDSLDFISAAKLFLLAKHVHGCLQYDTQTGGQVLNRFPVIAKQWAAISHFKTAIIQVTGIYWPRYVGQHVL